MCNLDFDSYDDIIHRHRLACWFASRAAQAGSAPTGFTVRAGREMIEAALFGGGALFDMGVHADERAEAWNEVWNNLPDNYDDFMQWHRGKRDMMIGQFNPPDPIHFHGRAAKLLNVYMKAFLFSEINDQARPVVHPPVDSKLLEGLKREIIHRHENGNPMANEAQVLNAILQPDDNGNPPHNLFLKGNEVKKWTQLTSDGYEAIIGAFHQLTDGVGLWKIEKFWEP